MFKYEGGEETEQGCHIHSGIPLHSHEVTCRWDPHLLAFSAFLSQEYDTLYREHNLLVQQVESWINKFTDTRNYKAEWTLKVTWVNAPAYPAGRTFGVSGPKDNSLRTIWKSYVLEP